jgi:2-oxoglutarate dehydrogenase E2 component (dihydrolipoamide succinyltransferase)
MPQLGESVVEGTVGKWLKSQGDYVEKYEPLLEVITDKVDSEITAPDSGSVLRIYVAEGETVRAGRLLAYIGQQGDPIPEPGSPEALEIVAPHDGAPEPAPSVPVPMQAEEEAATGEMRVTPVVARIAAEHHVDVRHVTGTGRDGRVTKQDILRYIEVRDATMPREQKAGEFFHPPGEKAPEAAPEPAKAVPPRPATAPGELLLLSPMRKAIAEHMVRSVHVSPHVSTIFEIDCIRIVADREAHKADYAQKGVKLTFTPYFVLASVEALKAVPVVNSTFTEAGIQFKREINIGIAVAVDEVIVPVIRHVDEKSLHRVAREVNDLAARHARSGCSPTRCRVARLPSRTTASPAAWPRADLNRPRRPFFGVE